MLHDQLGRTRKVRINSSIETGDKHIITGKTHAHKSVEHQDDQMIALLIDLVESHRVVEEHRVKRIRRD